MSEELPRYKCHKEVRAVRIVAVMDDMIVPEQGYSPFKVDRDWLERHKPMPGDYYVVYADDYKSVSPPEAFESGYTRVPADWKGRVREELRELDEKLAKLMFYIRSAAWQELDVDQRGLMLEQQGLMLRYAGVLKSRLDL